MATKPPTRYQYDHEFQPISPCQQAPDMCQRAIGTLPTHRHGLEKHAPRTASGEKRIGMRYATALVTASVIGK